MIRETQEVLVGAAIVAALAFLFLQSYKASEFKTIGANVLTATFNRVDGLVVGDEVRLGGIRVGSVQRMTLVDDFRARIALQLDAGVRIPTDSAAAIHTDGLFGTKFVVLDPGGEENYYENGDNISFTQDAVLVDELLELIIAEGKAKRARKNRGGADPPAKKGS
ncbi:MAG: MlaD family protein [Rhodospirillales bacterium]|jgi:phospholipid/cholesterol/gamma-HCH transport system substrate-binding protein|nr:MlaD family protein [Rhodospirillales bacterium]MDP6804462.1 MlaD family protein [Rhodospirillales bacterium]